MFIWFYNAKMKTFILLMTHYFFVCFVADFLYKMYKIHAQYEKGGKKSAEKELLFHFYDGYIFQIMKLAAKREVLLRHLPL